MKKLLISSLLITSYAFSEIRGLECFADYENKIWFQIDLENKEVIWNHTSQPFSKSIPRTIKGRSLEETSSRIIWKRGDRVFVLFRDNLELSWSNKESRSRKYKCSLLSLENLIQRRDAWYKFKMEERINGK
ncbi:MAG: hypothetical protein VX720_04665 [Pseudomonadota bacterium]|nr:hypothetical protein [Pseudomonadota bacterium]